MADYPTSVYGYGARLGLRMGAWLCAMSACLLLSVKLPAAIFLLLPLLLLLPVYHYRLMAGVWKAAPEHRNVSALWLLGIVIFVCGSLICALATGVEMLLFQPHFFPDYIRQTILTLQQAGMQAQYAEQIEFMHKMLEARVFPTPMQFVISMLWATTFSGSVISLVFAIMLQRRKEQAIPPMRL